MPLSAQLEYETPIQHQLSYNWFITQLIHCVQFKGLKVGQYTVWGTRGVAAGCGTLQAGRSQVLLPMASKGFTNDLIHSMALESTQPLTEMSTSGVSWGLKEAGA